MRLTNCGRRYKHVNHSPGKTISIRLPELLLNSLKTFRPLTAEALRLLKSAMREHYNPVSQRRSASMGREERDAEIEINSCIGGKKYGKRTIRVPTEIESS
jgi:hypothetical protein